MSKKVTGTLPLETKIELIAVKGNEIFKKEMTLGESLELKRKKGWYYIRYQLNFSQFD